MWRVLRLQAQSGLLRGRGQVDVEVQGEIQTRNSRREVKMSDKKPHQQHRHKKPQKMAPVITPEEQAKILAAREKAAAEAKAEAERIELFGKSVEKMSHKQLRAALHKTIKREHAGRPPQPQAGLTIAFATVLLAVLDNTRTADHRLRKDQINPTATKTMNPGW
jgi:hypothetical protein